MGEIERQEGIKLIRLHYRVLGYDGALVGRLPVTYRMTTLLRVIFCNGDGISGSFEQRRPHEVGKAPMSVVNGGMSM